MSIGSRLREERERLKMTQEKFAVACGVRRRAQVTYESGERSPDANYLEAASRIGADIAYVIYGERTSFEETLRRMVIEDLFFTICFELGFDDEDAQSLVRESVKTALGLYQRREEVDGLGADLVDPVKEFLSQSDRIRADRLDAELLETVIEQLESLLLQKKISLGPKKRALAAIMLYRAFKTSGKVDPKMIEEAINLASQSAA